MCKLYPYQQNAVGMLRSGSILRGGVGSGKSITALAYFLVTCGSVISESGEVSEPTKNVPLYIITTAMKRDNGEWAQECKKMHVTAVIDSWNNIKKYESESHAFFIFDEQRVVGSGVWVKAFLRIAANNRWILLSATPGDTWIDYIPVFQANGFYKNRSDFLRRHVIFSPYTTFPKIERYINVPMLEMYRKRITVNMDFSRETVRHHRRLVLPYDQEKTRYIVKMRKDPDTEEFISTASEVVHALRKVCGTDPSRVEAVRDILKRHNRIIVFYNFNYERDLLLRIRDAPVAQWNGSCHMPVPDTDRWMYLVQYAAGSEGWNCVTANTVVFYSMSYSYRKMEQASGRVDRMNTHYTDLYYYTLISDSPIEHAIEKAVHAKERFNERAWVNTSGLA